MAVLKFLTLCTACLLLLPAWVAAEQDFDPTPREPAYRFVVEKRRYFNPDAPTTGSLPNDALEELEESGWSPIKHDEEIGVDYISRLSAVEITPDAEGDLEIHEAVLVVQGTREIILQRRPMRIPIVTNRHAAGNLLLARHPLAMVLPRFQEITEFKNPLTRMDDSHPSGRIRMHDNTWLYILNPDSETGDIADIAQYHIDTNMLVKRVIFEDWHDAPSGRRIPRNVYTRTFLGNDNRPVVEVRFVNIDEEELPPMKDPLPVGPMPARSD